MSKNLKPGRDAIERIRTIYWFEGVRIGMRAKTAYAVERMLEPESFGVNKDGVPFHRNKWATYQNGQHTPNLALVAQVNQHIAGSSRELNHLLWKILSKKRDVSIQVDEWFRQLSPELQLLIYGDDDHFRIHCGSQFLGQIERRASLDVLAYLTISLQINYEHGNHERTWKLALSLYRVLLMLGHHFNERGIATLLFDIYVERVFRKIRWDNKRFYFDEQSFVNLTCLLNACVRSTKEFRAGANSWHSQVKVMQRIFGANYGLNWRYAFEPLIGPDRDVGPTIEIDQKKFERNRRLIVWGLETMFTGSNTDLPPAAIWSGKSS
jgi:hypothetical protein